MDKMFFTGNRRRLWEQMPQEECLVMLFSGLPRRRSADEDYSFYADRSFVYLTGIEQKDVVYLAWQSGGAWEERLFLAATDAMHERWHGRMVRPEAARERSGIAKILPRTALEGTVKRLLSTMTAPRLWLDFDPLAQEEEQPQKFAGHLTQEYPYVQLGNLNPMLRRLRTAKQPVEIEELRRSIELTGAGIREMLKVCRPGMYEYQLRAAFEKVLADAGYREPGFSTIVAAGKNTLVMHYPEQDCQLQDGDLILIDLGAQCGYCGADISRVFPANGRFTERQKLLHRASMTTVDDLAARVKPGMMLADVEKLTDEILTEKLTALGLMEQPEDLKKYRWHRVSHHLGFDTHDTCDESMALVPGAVITMEVGIYVEAWGEGVRVEDDVLITETGCENLSCHLPRTVEEIEALMNG